MTGEFLWLLDCQETYEEMEKVGKDGLLFAPDAGHDFLGHILRDFLI